MTAVLSSFNNLTLKTLQEQSSAFSGQLQELADSIEVTQINRTTLERAESTALSDA